MPRACLQILAHRPSLHDGGSYRAPSELVCLAVVVLVIRCLSITVHSHDVGEYGAWTIVLVCIKEHAEAFEVVGRAKDIARGRALLGEPHGKAVAVEVALAGDLEIDEDLFV